MGSPQGGNLKVETKSKKKTLIAWGSLYHAKNVLEQENLIRLDPSESYKTKRNETVYMPTFKGVLYYLATKKQRPEEVIRVLERNGKRLQYPLFQHAKALVDQWGLLEVTSFFGLCAKNRLGSPKMVQLEHWSRGLDKSKLESAASNIVTLHQMEDQLLRDKFFLKVLEWFSDYRKVPNPEIHSYTKQLLQRKKDEFNEMNKLLDAGLVLFGT